MPKVHPEATSKIDEYIENLPLFAKRICASLRKIMFKGVPDIIEDWKWGPNYQYPQGNMICGFGAATGWVTLAFFNGASLKDPYKLLTSGKSNAHSRSMKFLEVAEINEKILTSYLQEAIQIPTNPLKQSTPKPPLLIPPYLKKALTEHGLLEKFEELTYTCRKEYILSIEDAKKPETKKRRLDKIVSEVAESKCGRFQEPQG